MAIDYTPANERQRIQRLRALIERSKIYTSILADKLLKQQSEHRERGEEIDRQRRQADSKTKKEAIVAAGPTRKSSRTATVSAQDQPEKASPKKTRATTKAKKKTDISDYFKKEELDELHGIELSTKEALKQAQEEAQEELVAGVTAITKPSASARQPELVTGCVLRDYQLAGLEWLISLYENGLNGILADEMGLGKTLQTIAFLAFLRSKGTYGPFLVAAPLSTLSNWINEIKTFAPTIPCLLYHGDKGTREELRKKNFGKKVTGDTFPIVVTSYEIVMKDRQYLSRIRWKFIIIDEGTASPFLGE